MIHDAHPDSLLRRYLPALFLATLPALSAQTAPTPAPPLPALKQAAQLGADLYQHSGSVGMVLVVVRGNQVFFEGYGETAPASGKTPNDQSVIRICSLTKIFTTDVLTKLVADKTVRLGDTLAKYAPQDATVPDTFALPTPAPHDKPRTAMRRAARSRPLTPPPGPAQPGTPITLEELATHTSGLPREVGTGPRGTPHFTYPDYPTRWQWLATQHLLFNPGTQALYSNIGFDLLSDALQAAAHTPYARLLAERTLNPLKMSETTFYPNASQCSRLMQSIGNEGPCAITEGTEGSSGLYSTPREMAIWLKYLLRTGIPTLPAQDPAAQKVYLLPSDLRNEQGLDHAGTPTGIGLGWMHLLPPSDPSHIIQKTGGGAGFTTYIAINQSRKTAIFLAATDGYRTDRDFSLFKSANNLLLTMAGLPLLPPEAPKPVRRSAQPAYFHASHSRSAPPAARSRRNTPIKPRHVRRKAENPA